MEMQITCIDVDIESYIRRPAYVGRSELYLIEDNKIIGKVRASTAQPWMLGVYKYVQIQPADDATREYFKNDRRMIDGYLFGVRYDGVYGDRYLSIDDGNEPLYTETRIVDVFEFDFGFCHKQFHDVEGFGSYRRINKSLRIHTKHKSRRSRNSNKIKKVPVNL